MNQVILQKVDYCKTQKCYLIPPSDYRYNPLTRIIGPEKKKIKIALLNQGKGYGLSEKSSDGVIRIFPEEPLINNHPHQEKYLIVGSCRPIMMKRVFHLASCFGVTHLYICDTDLSEKSYFSSKLYRSPELIKHYLLSGLEQSTSYYHLPLVFPLKLWEILQVPEIIQGKKNNNYFILDLGEGFPSLYQSISSKEDPLLLAIGPERGWSPREREILDNFGLIKTSLGSPILRTDFALCAALATAEQKINC